MVTFGMFWSLMLSVCRLCYSGYSFGNVWVCFLAQFRLLGAKFGLRRVTLNSGVCLGHSVITIGHPGLGLGLGDSVVCFSYLVLSFGYW